MIGLCVIVKKFYLNKIKEITDKKMLDLVFDVTGNPLVLELAVKLLKKLGRVVLVGNTSTPSKQSLGPGLVSNSISIIGVHGYSFPVNYSIHCPWSKNTIIELFFEFVEQKRMNPAEIITDLFSPAECVNVYKDLLENSLNSIGIVFDWKLL
jgi:threonine dehydrogenase-like Zn-dependent dehydrogenase